LILFSDETKTPLRVEKVVRRYSKKMQGKKSTEIYIKNEKKSSQ
jgi:hypothetical protein